jgi:hypothetical protein
MTRLSTWLRPWRDRREDNGRDFTDADRDEGSIGRLQGAIRKERIRYLRARLQQLRDLHDEQLLESEVDGLEAELKGEEQDDGVEQFTGANPDAMLAALFMQVLGANKKQAASAVPEKMVLTDEQLLAYKKKIPAPMLRKLRGMKDEELLHTARMYAPDLMEKADEETITRAIRILRA